MFLVGNLRNPDNTYELTSDNVLKMLATYMRFKSSMPVVIMGETGSGKTRYNFLCYDVKYLFFNETGYLFTIS